MDKKNTINEFNIKFGNFAGLQNEIIKLKKDVFSSYKRIVNNNPVSDLPYTMLFPLVYLSDQEFYTYCKHWSERGFNYHCPDTIMAIRTILEADIALRYDGEGLSKSFTVTINKPDCQFPVETNVNLCRYFEKKSVAINDRLIHDDTTVREYFDIILDILV